MRFGKNLIKVGAEVNIFPLCLYNYSLPDRFVCQYSRPNSFYARGTVTTRSLQMTHSVFSIHDVFVISYLAFFKSKKPFSFSTGLPRHFASIIPNGLFLNKRLSIAVAQLCNVFRFTVLYPFTTPKHSPPF